MIFIVITSWWRDGCAETAQNPCQFGDSLSAQISENMRLSGSDFIQITRDKNAKSVEIFNIRNMNQLKMSNLAIKCKRRPNQERR